MPGPFPASRAAQGEQHSQALGGWLCPTGRNTARSTLGMKSVHQESQSFRYPLPPRSPRHRSGGQRLSAWAEANLEPHKDRNSVHVVIGISNSEISRKLDDQFFRDFNGIVFPSPLKSFHRGRSFRLGELTTEMQGVGPTKGQEPALQSATENGEGPNNRGAIDGSNASGESTAYASFLNP